VTDTATMPTGPGSAGGAGGPGAPGEPPTASRPAGPAAPGPAGGAAIGRLHVLVDSVPLAEAALEGGAPTLQVRVKLGPDRRRFDTVAAIAERCRDAGAACLVNDRADFAVAAGADGVHVGAEDLPVAVVRRVVGPGAVVGGTARDPATGRRLVEAGASYLGVGPTFVTRSKVGLPAPIGLEGLRAVAEAVTVPVIAIAGITAARVPDVLAAGAWGVAVLGAVGASDDPRLATRELVRAVARVAEELDDRTGRGDRDDLDARREAG
jgi:thiamine-phosphate pyrophosphorylase